MRRKGDAGGGDKTCLRCGREWRDSRDTREAGLAGLLLTDVGSRKEATKSPWFLVGWLGPLGRGWL